VTISGPRHLRTTRDGHVLEIGWLGMLTLESFKYIRENDVNAGELKGGRRLLISQTVMKVKVQIKNT